MGRFRELQVNVQLLVGGIDGAHASGRLEIPTISGMLDSSRHVWFEACFNFRDLGGYETADGRQVRWNTLYRSDTLHRLTAADGKNFSALGLRTVIDLRSKTEVEDFGRLGVATESLVWHNIPMLDDVKLTARDVSDGASNAPGTARARRGLRPHRRRVRRIRRNRLRPAGPRRRPPCGLPLHCGQGPHRDHRGTAARSPRRARRDDRGRLRPDRARSGAQHAMDRGQRTGLRCLHGAVPARAPDRESRGHSRLPRGDPFEARKRSRVPHRVGSPRGATRHSERTAPGRLSDYTACSKEPLRAAGSRPGGCFGRGRFAPAGISRCAGSLASSNGLPW